MEIYRLPCLQYHIQRSLANTQCNSTTVKKMFTNLQLELFKRFRSGDLCVECVFSVLPKYIYYKPEDVTITSIPLNPLLNSADQCALTTSVLGTTPADALTTKGNLL